MQEKIDCWGHKDPQQHGFGDLLEAEDGWKADDTASYEEHRQFQRRRPPVRAENIIEAQSYSLGFL